MPDPAPVSSAAQTIDDVLARLDAIIHETRAEGSRLGFFAVLYRGVTQQVKEGIAVGRFEDGARMERLDVVFANRYLAAYAQRRRGEAPSRCWATAFEASTWWSPLILQHVLLGMNAHINLDLAVAAARTAPGAALPGLKHDFEAINAILFEMLDATQDRLNRLSPWLGVLDRIGGRRDEWLARCGLKTARRRAWAAAEQLAPLPADAQEPIIRRLDGMASTLGQIILEPGLLLGTAMLVARLAERTAPSDVIDALGAAS